MNMIRFFTLVRETLQGWLLHLPFAMTLDGWLRARKAFNWGEPELRLLEFLVDSRKASVDAGAHRGTYTFWLRKFSSHVYAYEPTPGNFKFLSPLRGNVTAKKCALSNETGTATFRVPVRPIFGSNGGKKNGFRDIDSYGGTLQTAKPLEDFIEITVETRRLDDEGLERIGFIKIDTEGAEMEVLEGARELIARDRPVLLIEIEEKTTNVPVVESIKKIESMGYSAFMLTQAGLQVFNDEVLKSGIRNPRNRPIYNYIFLPTNDPAKT